MTRCSQTTEKGKEGWNGIEFYTSGKYWEEEHRAVMQNWQIRTRGSEESVQYRNWWRTEDMLFLHWENSHCNGMEQGYCIALLRELHNMAELKDELDLWLMTYRTSQASFPTFFLSLVVFQITGEQLHTKKRVLPHIKGKGKPPKRTSASLKFKQPWLKIFIGHSSYSRDALHNYLEIIDQKQNNL